MAPPGRLRWGIAAAMAALCACGDSSEPAAEGGPPGTADGGSEDASASMLSPGKLDVLLVLDDGQMLEKLQAFADQMPRFIEGLMSGDVDGDESGDFPPVTDLHVGIVSTDMGAGGITFGGYCEGLGDDGILQTATEQGTCRADMPRFHRLAADDDLSRVTEDLACLVPLGWMACGFEQPLDAALKALTPSTRDVSFHGGQSGHGDGENAGFLRPDARLLLVVVTDEDDCSASDPALYDPEGRTYDSTLSLRCVEHPEALQPLERYVTHLLALKPEPSAVRYALVAGVPPELTDGGEGVDFAAVLGDPRMEPGVDVEGRHATVSCEQEGLGAAFVPRRLVSFGSELAVRGARATLQSVCQPDYAPTIGPILRVALAP